MFIICEIGSNWSTMDDCKKSITDAKAIGADAVKFQMFSSEELYGSDIRPLTSPLPRDWVPILAEKARATGIEFMCTPFSVDGLKFIDPFVERHKIASSDMCHPDMLKAAKETGKPILLSTGGHSISDIQFSLSVLGNVQNLTLLYCESAYPAYHTDLRKLELLKKFGCAVGLSDHSREIFSIPLLAQQLHCTVLEKHCNFVQSFGPDAPHSLNLSQMKEMIRALRGQQGSEQSLISSYEQDMVTMHNRRLIAKCDINSGDTFIYEKNFGAYRSTRPDTQALHPALAMKVHGLRSKSQLKKGDAITPNSWE